MKLLHLTEGSSSFTVMLYDPETNVYRYSSFTAGAPEKIKSQFRGEEYSNREHFAGVIGKFMPEVWILGDAYEIDISEPSFAEMQRAAALLKKRSAEKS